MHARTLLVGALLLSTPLTGCIVPENMTALRQELGYASVETPELVAKARASTLTPRVHENVTFTAEIEGQPLSNVTLRWTIGEATARGPQASYTFSEPGNRTVELTAEGSHGTLATDRLELTVRRNHAPRPQIAIEDRQALTTGEPVTLSALSSTDPDGDELTYRWLVDGSTLGEGPRVTERFEAGVHRVKLVASDGYNETAAFDRFTVARPLGLEANLTATEPEAQLAFDVRPNAEQLAVQLTHSTRAGTEDVQLVLLGPDGNEVAASRTDPEPGSSQAKETLTVDGDQLTPGAYTLEARLDRGVSSTVTIEGVLTYSTLAGGSA